MKDKVFLDTNIIVYLFSEDEPKKRLVAQNLLINNESILSTQVIQEFINVLRKKHKAEWKKINFALEEITSQTSLYTNQLISIKRALIISEKTKYSFYDSLIIASALEANCSILYSEDMQHNQLIEKKLRIINPFL